MTTRFLDLAGSLNFRDLGGYPTRDGGRVRWNRLYRSGALHALTDEGLEGIHSAGIRYAYDLRTNSERRSYPNPLARMPPLSYDCGDHERLPGNLNLRSPGTSAGESRRQMMLTYRRIPVEFGHAFRTLFQHLMDDRLPLVFNCTAGKDRTGVAAALILEALGVSRDDIVEDYLLTERCYEKSCAMLVGSGGLFQGVPAAIWEPLLRVDADYLQAMFDELDASFGSVENYFSSHLGLDANALQRIGAHVLESR